MKQIEAAYRRTLGTNQRCEVYVYDTHSGELHRVFDSADLLLEAPNWTADDALILNGAGTLWRLDLQTRVLDEIDTSGLPYLNNDHVLDGQDHILISAFDWHIYRLNIRTGDARQITQNDPARPLRRFLHGLSRDGQEIAFVGIEPRGEDPWGPANIFTAPISGHGLLQLTFGDSAADGCEYSPDGDFIYFNTEAFGARPGHAQIARIPRRGGNMEQLTLDDRVNWFPHLAPVGGLACYLSYPPGTIGHPENKPVELKLVRDRKWDHPETIVRLFGGQGTINVNSWSPDGRRFAFAAYPAAVDGSDNAQVIRIKR